VQDDGVGLTRDQLGLLFREGVQFDPNKHQTGGGSGLGLCITREILKHHSGIIAAHSEGTGATFTLEIPVYECDCESTKEPIANDEDVASTAFLSSSASQLPPPAALQN